VRLQAKQRRAAAEQHSPRGCDGAGFHALDNGTP
jgi:hypothetical protein